MPSILSLKKVDIEVDDPSHIVTPCLAEMTIEEMQKKMRPLTAEEADGYGG